MGIKINNMNKEVLDLIKSSKQLFLSDIKSAEKKAKKALEISISNGLVEELAQSLITLSRILSDQGNIEEVTAYLYEALGILKKTGNKQLLIEAYSGLGNFYMKTGELDDSLSFYMLSLSLSIETGDKIEKPGTLLAIGTVLSFKESGEDALEYYFNAKQAAEETNNTVVISKALNNIGCEYNVLNRLDDAEKSLNNCIDICKKEKFHNINIVALDELGLIFRKKGEDKKAVNSWMEAIEIDISRGESYNSTAPRINLADFYISKEKWDLARKFLDDACKMCENTESRIDLVEIFKLETKISECAGDYKRALEFHKKYFEMERELRKQESVRALKEVRVQALTHAKDRLVTLGHIGRAITESLDLKTMLSRIYSNVGKLLDFSIIGMATYDSLSRKISYELFMENGQILPNTYTSADDYNSLAAWVIRQEKPLVISDYIKEFGRYVRNKDIKSITRLKVNDKIPNSILYNPLKIGDEIIGLITVQSYKINAYTADEIDSFDILASYASIGLNNALQAEKIKKQNKELSILATSDSLTGLKNRRAFFDAMEKCWSWSIRTHIPLSLILIDLDFFKKVNDTYGHPAGDYCLVEISKLLKDSVKRGNDEVARLGGEEFGIFLGDTDNEGANVVAENIRKKVEAVVFKFESYDFKITASMGIRTISPDMGKNIKMQNVISEADKALYEAKHSGRNIVKNFSNEL